MSSIIRLDALTLPSVNDYVEFQSGETPNMRETFVSTRTQFGQSEIGSSGTSFDKVSYTLGALVGSLTADYNSTSSFIILLNTDVPPGYLPYITIESDIDDYFTQAKWVDSGSNFTATFTNEPTVPRPTIDSVVFTVANPGVPCTQVNATITTSEQVDSYGFSELGTFFPVSTNPFTLATLNRATSYSLYVKKCSGSSSTTPTLQTNALSNVTLTTATSGGNSIDDGGSSILDKGVEYSLTSDFSSLEGTLSNGTGGANFTSYISQLQGSDDYFIRAYARNANGKSYGNVVDLVRGSDPFPIASTSFNSESDACDNVVFQTQVFLENGYLDLDEYVYTNSGLTNAFQGLSTASNTIYYSVQDIEAANVKTNLRIDSTGKIIAMPSLCP